MRGLLRTALLGWAMLALLLQAPAPAQSEEEPATPSTPEEWVAAVRGAARARDKEELLSLARTPLSDPWRAVDWLHADEAFEYAVLLAGATPMADARALLAYAQRTTVSAVSTRKLLAQAVDAGERGAYAEATKVLESIGGTAPEFLRVEAALSGARLAVGAAHWTTAVVRFAEAADLARDLGWNQGHLDALDGRFHALGATSDGPARLELLERRAALAVVMQDQLSLLETLVWRGGVLAELGRPREGARVVQRALPQIHQVVREWPGADEYAAEAHSTLSQLLAMVGEYALALHHGHRAELAYRRLGSVPGVLYAREATIATVIGLHLNEYACGLCKEQVDLAKPADGHADYRARGMLAWAIAEARLGRRRTAADHFRDALKHYKAQGGVPDIALLRLNRASELYEPGGSLPAAIDEYRAILGLDGLPRRLEGYARAYLAGVTEGQTARRHATEARLIAEAEGDGTLKVLALAAESRLVLTDGDAREARVLAQRAIACVLAVVPSLGAGQAMGFLGGTGPQRAARALIASSLAAADDTQLFEAIETTRAMALLASLGGRDAVSRVGPQESLVAELAAAGRTEEHVKKALEAARSTGGREGERRQLRKDHEAAVARVAGLEARIRGERMRLAHVLRAQVVPLAKLQNWLRPDEALIEYLVSGNHLHALVVTAQLVQRRNLGKLESLKKAALSVEALRYTQSQIVRDSAGRLPGLGELARLLIGNLELPDAARSLIVAPSIELANLPWPLIGRAAARPRVTLCPSASTLEHLRHEAFDGHGPRLAIGVSRYQYEEDGHARKVYAGSWALPDLPAAATEALEVAGSKAGAFTNGRASEDVVKGLFALEGVRRSVIHFACHGILHPKRPALSALALLPGSGQDGFLSATEILGLHMDSDLVVLSSCDTGSMQFVAGEGAVGLPSALLGAGAARVLANLWHVSDEAGIVFMRLFYGHLAKHHDAHAALRIAQLEFQERYQGQDKKRDWAHPYYWAGWVLWGSPR